MTPVSDTWVDEAAPNANHGRSIRFVVAGGTQKAREGYLKFNVGEVAGTIVGAKLRLLATTDTRSHLSVYAGKSDWTETGLTWANRSLPFGEPLDSLDGATRNTWFEFDVGEYVEGTGLYTFVLTADSTDSINIASRQSAHRPELILDVIPSGIVPTITPTATATFTATPTQTPTVAEASLPSIVAAVTEPAFTPTVLARPSTTATITMTATSAVSATNTSIATYTPTPFPTATNTPTVIPTATSSPTPGPTSTVGPSAIILTPAADARVDESQPDLNRGTGKQLRVDGDKGARVESYFVFRVRGLTGPVAKATLRVYSLMDTKAGPSVYAASSDWTEGGITWANRPARTSDALDSVSAVSASTWVEFDVTAVVTTSGVYTFVLETDSTDGMNMNSREAATNRPELVIYIGSGSTQSGAAPIATWTPSPPASADLSPRRFVLG